MQFVLAVISDKYIGWNDILYIKRYWQHSEECMSGLRNIAMRDYQGKRDYRTDTHTDGRTDAGQSDPYVPLCFAGDTTKQIKYNIIANL